MQINYPNGVKPKMIERKLRIGVNWREVLMQKRRNKTGAEQGIGVLYCLNIKGDNVKFWLCLMNHHVIKAHGVVEV
jgi:hypothetical protein